MNDMKLRNQRGVPLGGQLVHAYIQYTYINKNDTQGQMGEYTPCNLADTPTAAILYKIP